MMDEIDMRTEHLSWWNEGFEHGMGALSGTSTRKQTEPCRYSVDMGINGEGLVSTGKKQDTGNGFWAYARKFRQERAGRWHGHIHQKIQSQTAMASLQSM